MGYPVEEVVYTIQGEGANTGRSVVLCRFANGDSHLSQETSRDNSDDGYPLLECLGRGIYRSPESLARVIASKWPKDDRYHAIVIFTGEDPLSHLDSELVNAMHAEAVEVAVQTNGTMLPPGAVDWITVSPVAGADLVLEWGSELIVDWPQNLDMEALSKLRFEHYFVRPARGPNSKSNLQTAIRWCMECPTWRLSINMDNSFKAMTR